MITDVIGELIAALLPKKAQIGCLILSIAILVGVLVVTTLASH